MVSSLLNRRRRHRPRKEKELKRGRQGRSGRLVVVALTRNPGGVVTHTDPGQRGGNWHQESKEEVISAAVLAVLVTLGLVFVFIHHCY